MWPTYIFILTKFAVTIILLYNTPKKSCKIIEIEYFMSFCISALMNLQMKSSEGMRHAVAQAVMLDLARNMCFECDRQVLHWLFANLFYQRLLLSEEYPCILCGRF